ncbi:helix-turn-helix domain-containing protein [Comamonas sp. BIGb0124]|uniref:helix-turn-helix domain-containing protein n=1 Tax=Comamonas sp. BIGb0124 TaxID=2485130 RepID=UPI0013158DA5|nr:helix-turn-helix transcriptional regulator [Comamonas sp. BIGb0124]
MKKPRKPVDDPKTFGALLRQRRKSLGKTLTEIANVTSVDVSQLSRFETGHMKKDSDNLQKLLAGLQKLEAAGEQRSSVINRFASIMERSSRHAEAATAFVDALEKLK